MRVLILPSWYPTKRYPVGGIFCQEQARALNTLDGLEVVVLFIDRVPLRAWFQRGTKAPSMRVEGGLRVYRTRMPRLPGIWPLLYIFWALVAITSLKRRHNFRPDILHAHVALPAGLAGAVTKRVFHIPLVITEHTGPFSLLMRNRLAALATRLSLRSADRVITVSAALRDQILSYPQLRRSINVVPNMVNTDAFSPQSRHESRPDTLRVLFVGEMETDIKGVSYLLEAISLLRDRSPDISLDLVGDGRNREKYRSLAHDLGIADICHFHGWQSRDDLACLMSDSDILVLPSLAETFGVVLIEAMASGIPVVATRCGGPEEIVTPEVGLLVEPADATALANAIASISTRLDEFPAERLRKIAEERYGRAAVSQSLMTIYKQIVD